VRQLALAEEHTHFARLLDQSNLGFLPATYPASFGQPPDRRELGLLSIRDLDGLECGYWDHTAVELHLELLDSFETS